MQDAVRTELHEPPGAHAAHGALSGWTAALEMASRQPAGGIHLVIELTNHTGETDEILNPLDFLAAGISVTGAAGRRVELPRAAPRMLIHTGGAEKDRLNLPFRLEFVEVDGRRLAEREIEQKTIAVKPGGSVRIGIAIERVVPQGTAAPAAIPPGDYHVQVSLTLMSAGESQAVRKLQTAPVAVRSG